MENNSKKCEEFMNRYLELDKNERIPFRLSMHLFFCRKCHRQIKMLAAAEKAAASPLKLQVPLTDASIENVMERIEPGAYRRMIEKPISIRNWIISGIAMITLLFVPILITNRMHSRDLSIAYAVLIALRFTAACSCSETLIFSSKKFPLAFRFQSRHKTFPKPLYRSRHSYSFSI